MPSMVTFRLSLRVSEYCRFCAPVRHFIVSQNFPMFAWNSVDGFWATKSEGLRITVSSISFQGFQPMWSWLPTLQTDGRTDGQTDGLTTCNRNTALCTKVHRAVKIVHGCRSHYGSRKGKTSTRTRGRGFCDWGICLKDNNQTVKSTWPMSYLASLSSSSSSSSSAAEASSSSRWALHQVTSDDQGDHDDHVTRRWRHHRPVAQVGVTDALYAGADILAAVVRVQSTTAAAASRAWINENRHNRNSRCWLFLMPEIH